MSSGAVLKALLLADLVDSTGLVRRLGDAGAARVFARHDRLARDLLATAGGREIDKADGFLLLFDLPFDAVHFALAYHHALDDLSREVGSPMVARIGIHVGEVYLRENAPEDVARGAKPLEVEGLAKPMVARLVSLASGGQTLLTRGAFDLARRAAVGEHLSDQEVRWLAHGSYRFQGVSEPVEIFEVGAVGQAPLTAPGDSPKVRREVAADDEITLGWRPAAGQEIPNRPHWVLSQRVGEGGFGEVWLASHAKTGEQRVFKFCYQLEQLRALRREVTVFRLFKEVLGNRDDIARILDWNFDQAPYFLESEYTEGGNLVDWAREQGGIDRVPLASRLELIAQVAEALAAAHSVGVLHKDVKPANVLITQDRDGSPRARLTDFGIGLITDSRLLADRGITIFGLTELASDMQEPVTGGTHLYMAPELLEGRVATVQADLYALGVMLYQVVVGNLSHALAPGWRRQVEDELLREDIAHFVDGEPSRRPGSALEVAERLRTLEERRAKRQAERRAREEAERSHRRRRLSATIAAVASLFLVVVSILAVQAVQARREAEQRREQAEELVSFMLGDLTKKLNPVSRREVLGDIADQVLSYFDSLPREHLSDSELFRRSKALTQICEVRIDEGDLPAALDASQEALGLAQDLVDRDRDNPEWQYGLGQAHFWMGNILRLQGDAESAFEHLRQYLSISKSLAEQDPDNDRWQLEVAYGHNNLGLLFRDQGALPKARDQLLASLAIKQGLAERKPENVGFQYSLAVAHNAVGSMLQEMGELEQALSHYRSDVAIKSELVSRQPENLPWRRSLALSRNYVGRLLEVLGEPQAALEEYRAAVAELERLVADDPANAGWRRDLAVNSQRMALGVLRAGEPGRALEIVRSARETIQGLAEQDPTNRIWQSDLAWVHYRTAQVLAATRQLATAMEELATSQEILHQLIAQQPGDRSLESQRSCNLLLLGRLHDARGQTEAARKAWSEAEDALAPFTADSSDFNLLAPRARALLYLERLEEARPLVEKLLAMGYREAELMALCDKLGLV